jgi:hypothetical protein
VFFDAGPTYAIVRVTAVENWPRVFTKPSREDLSKVAAGTYKFSEHEHLLWAEKMPSDGQTNGSDDDDIGASDKTPDNNEKCARLNVWSE